MITFNFLYWLTELCRPFLIFYCVPEMYARFGTVLVVYAFNEITVQRCESTHSKEGGHNGNWTPYPANTNT